MEDKKFQIYDPIIFQRLAAITCKVEPEIW